VIVDSTLEAPKASARAVLIGGCEVAIPLEGLIDFAQERARLSREKEKLGKESASLRRNSETRLRTTGPVEKVEESRVQIADLARRSAALDEMLEALA